MDVNVGGVREMWFYSKGMGVFGGEIRDDCRKREVK